jgi:hypothetical protein
MGLVAHLVKTRIWWGKLRARLAPRRGIILKWFLVKSFGRAWTVLLWLRIGTGSLPFYRLL